MELDTEEQEITAVEAGFKQAIIGAFVSLYTDTSEHSKWGDAAVIRFQKQLVNARAARQLALKIIEECRSQPT